MKKLFISLLTVAATLNVMATSSVTIRIEDNDGWAKNMILTESTEGTIAMEVNNASSVALYAMYNSKKCEQLRLETLGELPIGFKIQATTATMTVTKASGDALYMKTLADGTITELKKDAVINITIASDKVNTWVEDMYQLCAAPQKDYTRDAATVVGNWYTICVPGGVDATEYAPVMDVYTVGGYDAAQGLAVDPMTDAMQPGVPYIFLAKATQIAFNYNEAEEAPAPQEGTNNLTGTFVETTTPAVAYVVANNILNWAAAGTTVPAYRAYLNVADITELPIANNAPGRKFLPAPKGVVTGLDGAAINGMKNGKYIMNGRFMIVKDGKTTNVLGL